eukprot:6897586-Prymnesium_polylepis.1
MKFLSVADNLDKLDAHGEAKASSMRKGAAFSESGNSIAGDSESEANLYTTIPRSPRAAATLAANRAAFASASSSGAGEPGMSPSLDAVEGGKGWSPTKLPSALLSSASRLLPNSGDTAPESAVP